LGRILAHLGELSHDPIEVGPARRIPAGERSCREKKPVEDADFFVGRVALGVSDQQDGPFEAAGLQAAANGLSGLVLRLAVFSGKDDQAAAFLQFFFRIFHGQDGLGVRKLRLRAGDSGQGSVGMEGQPGQPFIAEDIVLGSAARIPRLRTPVDEPAVLVGLMPLPVRTVGRAVNLPVAQNAAALRAKLSAPSGAGALGFPPAAV